MSNVMAQKKESNGTWSFYGKLPKDENGKRRNYKRKRFKSKKAAELAEAEFLKQYNNLPNQYLKKPSYLIN